jgi:hypothetical protein
MFSKYLESITGIGIYPMFSLVIFFGFFSLLLLYLVKADKQMLQRAANIPLNSSETDEKTGTI